MANNRTCLINQPAGLGDILLCQKIASHLIDIGYDIIWPVVPYYDFISEYIKKDGLTFFNTDEDFPYKDEFLQNQNDHIQTEDFLYLPLTHATRAISTPTRSFLYAKYEYCQLTTDNWLDHFKIIRNIDREQKLIDHLGVDINEPYNVVNKTFATPPDTITNQSIIPNNDFNIINMELLGWDRIFDWMGILENATEVHTVDTSITLILAKLGLKNVHIYERTHGINANYSKPNPNYLHKELFCNEWNYYTSLTENGF